MDQDFSKETTITGLTKALTGGIEAEAMAVTAEEAEEEIFVT